MRRSVYYRAQPVDDTDQCNLIAVSVYATQPDQIIATNLTKENAERIVTALEREPESPDYAVGILRRDYYSDVRSVAESLIDRVKNGEIEDEDDLQTALHEDIDGHQRIIYTFQAKISLLASDNEDAIEDAAGTDANTTVEQRAYYAMRADVEECLTAQGVDLNDLQESQIGGISNAQIDDLRREAIEAGDTSMAELCNSALRGNSDHRAHCAKVISDKPEG